MYTYNKIGNNRDMYIVTIKEIVKNIHMSIGHRSKSMIGVYGSRVQSDRHNLITVLQSEKIFIQVISVTTLKLTLGFL